MGVELAEIRWSLVQFPVAGFDYFVYGLQFPLCHIFSISHDPVRILFVFVYMFVFVFVLCFPFFCSHAATSGPKTVFLWYGYITIGPPFCTTDSLLEWSKRVAPSSTSARCVGSNPQLSCLEMALPYDNHI